MAMNKKLFDTIINKKANTFINQFATEEEEKSFLRKRLLEKIKNEVFKVDTFEGKKLWDIYLFCAQTKEIKGKNLFLMHNIYITAEIKAVKLKGENYRRESSKREEDELVALKEKFKKIQDSKNEFESKIKKPKTDSAGASSSNLSVTFNTEEEFDSFLGSAEFLASTSTQKETTSMNKTT